MGLSKGRAHTLNQWTDQCLEIPHPGLASHHSGRFHRIKTLGWKCTLQVTAEDGKEWPLYPTFNEIGGRFGGSDLATGTSSARSRFIGFFSSSAYERPWSMSAVHGVLQHHPRILKARLVIATHWYIAIFYAFRPHT